MRMKCIWIRNGIAFVFLNSLCACGQSTRTSAELSTLARVRHIANIIAECDQSSSAKDPELCISQYMRVHGLGEDKAPHLYTDYFGEELILKVSDKCKVVSPRIPYSKGPNGMDECGGGDDIR